MHTYTYTNLHTSMHTHACMHAHAQAHTHRDLLKAGWRQLEVLGVREREKVNLELWLEGRQSLCCTEKGRLLETEGPRTVVTQQSDKCRGGKTRDQRSLQAVLHQLLLLVPSLHHEQRADDAQGLQQLGDVLTVLHADHIGLLQRHHQLTNAIVLPVQKAEHLTHQVLHGDEVFLRPAPHGHCNQLLQVVWREKGDTVNMHVMETTSTTLPVPLYCQCNRLNISQSKSCMQMKSACNSASCQRQSASASCLKTKGGRL